MPSDPERAAVVITGSSTGIGRASALHLDRLGFKVFAGIRTAEDGERLRGEATDSLEPLILDVTDADQIARARETVSKATGGRLAGLVNNAGVGVGGPLELLPVDDFRRQIEVNLIGQVAVTQAFIPAVRAARGRIVFISSIGGLVATPYMAPYHASKFAVEAVGDSLRQELRPFGVQVAIVEPGSIATPIWDKAHATAETTIAGITEEGKEFYGDQIARMKGAIAKTAARGLPPEKVAGVVAEALTAKNPRTRYRVGADTRVMAAVRRILPDRLRDRLIARASGV